MTAAAPPIPGARGAAGKAAAGAAAATLAALIALAVIASAMSGRPANGGGGAVSVYGVSAIALRDIPPRFLGLYQQHAKAGGLDWAILAGIGKIETDHKRSSAAGVTEGANFLGCCGGPMQFFFAPHSGRLRADESNSSTWGAYGVDGNGDGYKDVWDEEDAIPAAVAYLRASGAPGDYKAAVWAYNHSDAYYRDVMSWADKYRGDLESVVGGGDPTQGLVVPEGGGDRVTQLVGLMSRMDAARIPYCYGGGHGLTPAVPSSGQYCWTADNRKVYGSSDRGLDCSSSTSWLLQALGYRLPTMTSGLLAGWGEPGPGRHVTIWTNAGHVYLEVNYGGRRLFFGTSAENYRHGPGWHSPRSPTGFIARHPAGL